MTRIKSRKAVCVDLAGAIGEKFRLVLPRMSGGTSESRASRLVRAPRSRLSPRRRAMETYGEGSPFGTRVSSRTRKGKSRRHKLHI